MTRPVILIVDDEIDLLQLTAEAVRRDLPTYRVLTARNVDEAEEVVADLQATDQSLALAVVDQVLGGATGLGLLETLRGGSPEMGLMLFTGRAGADVEDRARKSDVKVMWKPVRLRHLIGEMERLLPSQPV